MFSNMDCLSKKLNIVKSESTLTNHKKFTFTAPSMLASAQLYASGRLKDKTLPPVLYKRAPA